MTRLHTFLLSVLLICLCPSFAPTAQAQPRSVEARVQERISAYNETLAAIAEQQAQLRAELEAIPAEAKTQGEIDEASAALAEARRKRRASEITDDETLLNVFGSMAKSRDINVSKHLRRCRAALLPGSVNAPRLVYGCAYRLARKEASAVCSDTSREIYDRNFACQTGSLTVCLLPVTRQRISNCDHPIYAATRTVVAEVAAIDKALSQTLGAADGRLAAERQRRAAIPEELGKLDEQIASIQTSIADVPRVVAEEVAREKRRSAAARERAKREASCLQGPGRLFNERAAMSRLTSCCSSAGGYWRGGIQKCNIRGIGDTSAFQGCVGSSLKVEHDTGATRCYTAGDFTM